MPGSPAARADRPRFGWLDAVILAGVVAFGAFIVYRVDSVLYYRWNWSRLWPYIVQPDGSPGLLLGGFMTTIRLSLYGIVLAAILGLVFGLMRTSRRLLPRLLGRAYVELVRNMPPLVFIFIFYFFISSQITPLLGLDRVAQALSPGGASVVRVFVADPRLLENFVSGLICLALFEGAYVTEIVRAGVQSIDKGQWEAARSLGLSYVRTLHKVILPQAIRRVAPPLAGQFITLIKSSSIVSLISIQELTFTATEIAVTTERVFETWIVVAAMYFSVCYLCSLAFARLERRVQG
ncbi:MAG: amino acid ABC transporter permease [Alphaproteobacteria bacterium]|nr:amino acid ABC transporter permease [Alphaproteobacteria bacterium]